MNEDWGVLVSMFPDNWIETAVATGALKGLRKNKEAECFLRTLLLHVGCGHSLRETAARAKLAGLADLSDVALLGRLKKAKDWLHSLCVSLLEEDADTRMPESPFQARLFDATHVKEPGKTGSLWRIHYSLQIPSLSCDFFKITPAKGLGSGESFFQYSIKKGDYIIADRGYSTISGIHHVASKGAHVIVRMNTAILPVVDSEGLSFPLYQEVTSITKPLSVKSWSVLLPKGETNLLPGRVIAIRKSEEAIKISHEKLRRRSQKRGIDIKPETYEYAKYVIVFTTFPENRFSAFEVLEWYRRRWQIELVFKRFKTIAQLGHLPKRCDESALAWLYGKLFVALLAEKLRRTAESISPWGYTMGYESTEEPVA